MTICNMTIEGGGRAGMVAPDDTTFEWVEGRAARAGGLRRRRRAAGASCAPTTARAFDTRDRRRRGRAVARRSRGARTPAWSSGVTEAVPEPQGDGDERALKYMAPRGRHADRRRSRSTACSSARARTRGSATCAPPPRSSRAARWPRTSTRWSCPGSEQVRRAGRGRGARRGLPRRRLRLAHRRLLDVPGHEPRHPRSRASAAPRPPTATSRAARAAAGARTSSRRRWPPRPRSRGTSSTSGSGARWSRSRSSPATSACSTATTSTPTRSSPSSSSSASSGPASASSCSTTGRKEHGWDLPANPILVTGPNFGCGSSREHAPWALQDYGFKAVVVAELRGHLLQQLHEDRAAAGGAAGGRRARADGGGRGGDRPRGARGPLRRPRRRRSRSTTRPATGCSTASTTSRSRSSRATRSTPTSATARTGPARPGDDGAVDDRSRRLRRAHVRLLRHADRLGDGASRRPAAGRSRRMAPRPTTTRCWSRFARYEAALEAGPYRPYREILAGALRGLGARPRVRADRR